MDIFDGDWVTHPEFGSGVVIRANGDTEVRVQFDNKAGTHTVLAADLTVIG